MSKRTRLAKRAADLVALIRRRRAEISDAFYDMGEALTELKSRDMLSVMNARSFADPCESKSASRSEPYFLQEQTLGKSPGFVGATQPLPLQSGQGGGGGEGSKT